MIAGGNWWRANEIVIRHLTRQTATRYRCRDRALPLSERPRDYMTVGYLSDTSWLLP
jgi:hypothetical protein